jgi:hypothetical protein
VTVGADADQRRVGAILSGKAQQNRKARHDSPNAAPTDSLAELDPLRSLL